MSLLLLAIVILFWTTGVYGAEVTLGRLLERQYSTAREEWERDGCPTWWTWAPAGRDNPNHSAKTVRLRLLWLFVTPDWAKRDNIALRYHRVHRWWFLVMIIGWAGIIVVGLTFGKRPG
jgi:hypothetical protein